MTIQELLESQLRIKCGLDLWGPYNILGGFFLTSRKFSRKNVKQIFVICNHVVNIRGGTEFVYKTAMTPYNVQSSFEMFNSNRNVNNGTESILSLSLKVMNRKTGIFLVLKLS